jgi:hypothetical protein
MKRSKGRKMNTDRQAKSCGKAAPWKPLESGVPTALGNPATDAGFPLSPSFNTNKLDDRDHFQQNTKTSVASLRELIGSSRNIDRHHSGMLIDFIGIPTMQAICKGTSYLSMLVSYRVGGKVKSLPEKLHDL